MALPMLLLVLAQDGAIRPAVAPEILYRPTAQPSWVRLTWSADPATTQSITWRTSDQAGTPVVQFALAQPGPNIEKLAASVPGRSESVKSNLGWTTRYHSATITGLKPATEYVYRVGDGVDWSEWMEFRTAADKFEPFSFIYLGDIQNGIRTHASRILRRAYKDDSRVRFIINAGDLVNRANNEHEWGELYDALGWVNGSVPTIAAPGNHEYFRPAEGQPHQLSHHWRPHFEYPQNGPTGLEETCFSIDYQGLRVVVLNSMADPKPQAAWLEEKLKSNPNRWTVVTFHHPVFSSAARRDNPEIRAAWKPIIDKYRPDLVLQGHDHTYGRSDFKSIQSSVLTEGNRNSGTIYVVSVSGMKMYEQNGQPWMVRRAEDTQLYQSIRVEPDRLLYEAKTGTGEVYDAFTLVKQAGRPNRMIDRKPRTPESLRPKPPASGTGG